MSCELTAARKQNGCAASSRSESFCVRACARAWWGLGLRANNLLWCQRGEKGHPRCPPGLRLFCPCRIMIAYLNQTPENFLKKKKKNKNKKNNQLLVANTCKFLEDTANNCWNFSSCSRNEAWTWQTRGVKTCASELGGGGDQGLRAHFNHCVTRI